ncbi:MAG: sacsin N-terminal ATP-binding-like domain-containing protein, partial [Cellulomonadaceae bacterium]
MTDPFGTAALRRAVLDAWLASPTRYREDANTEEDHARGYYRDRVVTELAQNAADAAALAGAPGHLRLSLTSNGRGTVLHADNTGAPLTADGVRALASMRASSKSGSSAVGRFGVGFAAVRSVSDDVTIRSVPAAPGAGNSASPRTSYGVEFSLRRARAEIEAALAAPERAAPALAAQVVARGADQPVLRLPFPASSGDPVPAGWTTTVALRLRDEAADSAVRDQLAAVDELLLLALPALETVTIAVDGEPDREIRIAPERWTVHRAAGRLDPALLADRPVEERGRTDYALLWALGPARPGTVHAPTATDEPCTQPATLVATLP